MNAFAEAQRAVRRAPLERDVSFDRLLARTRASRKTKTFARMMVQGFDAADPARVSARSILEEWGEGGSLGASQPRPQGGYGSALRLARAFGRCARRAPAARLARHNAAWKRGNVVVQGRSFAFRARRAIVTLPLGVLQARAVRFSPSLGMKAPALGKLASGPVIRVAMRFHSRFWEKRAPEVAFFHVPQARSPTFWTPLPMRAPLLTAWAGGPKAARLTGSSRKALLAAALRSVGMVLDRKEPARAGRRAGPGLADRPLSRGGYS